MRIKSLFSMASVTVIAATATISLAAPAHAACGSGDYAAVSKTSGIGGGLSLRITYTYATCTAKASVINSNKYGLKNAGIKLYRRAATKCDPNAANGSRVINWYGDIAANSTKTISTVVSPKACFRIYLTDGSSNTVGSIDKYVPY
ncbi:hypothetical protein ACIBH1_29030 [Nonomuraea sp. NPDC050663]|uniref:hypothetical protein n=1 Tax=Nonomuraea sp. NPDC050663 TaxID=3364370 RepID=UPI0037B8059D